MAVRSYEELEVWQRAMDLVDDVYRASAELPDDERFGLVSQMCRAAVSVPANIAEGHGRLHRGDFLRHLSIASGSLRELETHLRIAQRQQFLAADRVTSLLSTTASVGRMLRRMRQALGARH